MFKIVIAKPIGCGNFDLIRSLLCSKGGVNAVDGGIVSHIHHRRCIHSHTPNAETHKSGEENEAFAKARASTSHAHIQRRRCEQDEERGDFIETNVLSVRE